MARRRKPKDEPKRETASLSLSGAGAIGPVGPGGGAAGVALEGPALAVELDARVLADGMSRAVLAATSDAIRAGLTPDGARQRPLSKVRAAEAGRESEVRGYRTGHFADELRTGRVVGTATSARVDVMPPVDRNVFVATEAARGIRYLGVGPAAMAAAERAAAELVEAQLEQRKLEPGEGNAVAREERGA